MSDDVGQGMNIIVFEGGLAGGLSSLMIFKEIMAGVRAAGGSSEIRKHCKVMTGTGTGALSAAMLGLLGMNVDQAIAAYSRLVESVFSDKKLISTSRSGTFKASKLEEELKKIVREATGDENTSMIRTLQGQQDCDINELPDYPIWQVLQASMAHPDLFKGVEVGGASTITESLVGGDIACSNPTAHVLAEVSALYPERHITSVLCIGAGHARTIEIPRSNPLHRSMPTNVLIAMKNIATESERVGEEMTIRFQDTLNVYFRFRVDQGMQDVRLSQWQRKGEVAAHTRAYMQKTWVTAQMDQAAQAIASRRGSIRAANIGGKVQQSLVPQMTYVKRCPAPSSAFTGCERQISQVINCLLSPTTERRVCVFRGLGGSGKTQLALKVIERTQDKWTDIVYADATSRETAISSLNGFASARSIGDAHEDALRWFELSAHPWLLVFDNADDPDMGLPKFLQEVGFESNCVIGSMDAEEAVELLLKKAHLLDQTLPGKEIDAATKLVQVDVTQSAA
ncbi:hypothetical protein FRC07_001170 [Ceratobasidium sp. 392]|nr:hypothetical protein FRC07_001170 [Ceratobasidium sp. 392]